MTLLWRQRHEIGGRSLKKLLGKSYKYSDLPEKIKQELKEKVQLQYLFDFVSTLTLSPLDWLRVLEIQEMDNEDIISQLLPLIMCDD